MACPTQHIGSLGIFMARDSATRPRLLFLSQCLPYPPHSGVANRTFNVLVQLQRTFDVHLLPFSRRNHQADVRARVEARAVLAERLTGVEEAVPISAESGIWGRTWSHVRSLLTGRPYTYYEYAALDYGRRLSELLVTLRPSLVHMDSLDLYHWLPLLSQVPVAVTHHSVESDLLASRARRIRPVALRPYLHLQARLLARVERRLCPEFPLNVMMSDVDALRLRNLAPGSRTVTVPNGVDTTFFRRTAGQVPIPGRILFLGPTYMYPNRDAVDFFLDAVWKEVWRAVPGATFHLVGKNPADHRARLSAYAGVTLHGYVPDVRPNLAEATCSVVPIRIGGGTRLKILDSWAMGVPVVSTTVGCEGLHALDGENILIRDDPQEFARAVIEVLSNEQLSQRLSEGGRATAQRLYAWDAIGERLIGAYQALLADPNRPLALQSA
jgi:glycosyltransferase involved in cell wall biosynthesis